MRAADTKVVPSLIYAIEVFERHLILVREQEERLARGAANFVADLMAHRISVAGQKV